MLEDMKTEEHDFIDTLYLSPLLFSARPYHHLLKNDKLQTEDLNNLLPTDGGVFNAKVQTA